MKTIRVAALASVLLIALVACDSDDDDSGPSMTAPLFAGPLWFTYGQLTAFSFADPVGGSVLAGQDGGGGAVELDRDTTDLVGGNAYSLIAYLDDAAAPALMVSCDWTQATLAPGAGSAGVRLYNVSNSDVDVRQVRPLTSSPLSAGDDSSFAGVTWGTAGTGFVLESTWVNFTYIAAGDEPVADSLDVIYMDDPSAGAGDPPVVAAWYPHDIPADLDTTGAAVRVISASANWQPVNVSMPTQPDVQLNQGDSTGWITYAIADGVTSSISIVVDWNSSAYSFSHPVSDLARGDVVTVVLRDDPSDPNAVIPYNLSGVGSPGGGEDAALRMYNASTHDNLMYGVEDESVCAAITDGQTDPAADGVTTITLDRFALSVRAAGAGADTAPDALGTWNVPTDGDMFYAAIHQSAGGATLLLEGSFFQPLLLPTSTAVRFIHAAEGVAELTGYTLE